MCRDGKTEYCCSRSSICTSYTSSSFPWIREFLSCPTLCTALCSSGGFGETAYCCICPSSPPAPPPPSLPTAPPPTTTTTQCPECVCTDAGLEFCCSRSSICTSSRAAISWEPATLSCTTECTALCSTGGFSVTAYCCTCPTTTTTPTTTTCPDCKCVPIRWGSYYSFWRDEDSSYCCSRAATPEIDSGIFGVMLYYVVSVCPNMCYAKCGDTFHCCVGSPRTATTTTTTTTTSPPSGGGGGCFPSTAKVQLKNGKSVKMSELQIGDRVPTAISLLICIEIHRPFLCTPSL